jgi:hypothetical protein
MNIYKEKKYIIFLYLYILTMNIKGFIRYHKLNIAIFIFLIIFAFIHFIKPPLLYNEDGSYRQFGIGYRNKTIIPIWLVSICIAILSYISVSYYLAYI